MSLVGASLMLLGGGIRVVTRRVFERLVLKL
jgi:hypothetical protein